MLTLDNGLMHVSLCPDLGGRIEDLIDLRTGKNWLWHPAGYQPGPRALPLGASFDDNWTGGWDEIFPNDAACHFQGRDLPVHGELWSQEWEVQEYSPLGAELAYICRSLPVTVTKRLTLDPQSPELRVDYMFINRSPEPLSFLFKLHPALAIEAGDEVLMPPCSVKPVDLGFSSLMKRDCWTAWPASDSVEDPSRSLAQVPPATCAAKEFVYTKDHADGFTGLGSRRTRSALKLAFNRELFPYVWLFQIYGGWQGHYVHVAEPCTNIPWDLEQAVRQGTCAVLPGGGYRNYTVTARIEPWE